MLLDAIFGIALVLGLFFGIRSGIVKSLISFLGIFLAMNLSLGLSYRVSGFLVGQGFESKYMPLIAFLLTFVGILFVAKLAGSGIEKLLKGVGLSPINKLAGAAVWAIIVAFGMSTLVFYLDQMKFITPEVQAESVSYNFLKSLSPMALETTGKVVPYIDGIFDGLKETFGEMNLTDSTNIIDP